MCLADQQDVGLICPPQQRGTEGAKRCETAITILISKDCWTLVRFTLGLQLDNCQGFKLGEEKSRKLPVIHLGDH